MYFGAYFLLLLAFVGSVGASVLALLDLWNKSSEHLFLVKHAHWLISGCFLLASALLLHALFWQDYSLQYVASYTDQYLPVFYRLTAFWAGQPGSMLFWGLTVALSGTLLSLRKDCRMLQAETQLWHWTFFHSVMAFFALLLTTFSNPFIMQNPVPPDGNGLNPLLQNPGMIFHPPLLFMGYAGFIAPCCLALAQGLTHKADQEKAWFEISRPFLLSAWSLLSAGIILGSWWAYMELGWGGYWAWDPVENSSLLPWLLATACLHTLVIQKRSHKLPRFNVFIITLTSVSTFFATFLVRSGVIDSVHAFGSGSVTIPLLLFILCGLFFCGFIPLQMSKQGEALNGLLSREGLLSLVAWFMLALAGIIALATIWPLLTKFLALGSRGLDASFYNRVCLPLTALLLAILAFCPLLGWQEGQYNKRKILLTLAVFLISAGVVWCLGYRQPVALLSTAAGVSIIIKPVRLRLPTLGAWGVHLGVALAALGIAFSGPYSEDRDLILATGQWQKAGEYSVRATEIDTTFREDHKALYARLEVQLDGETIGFLTPERRIYKKFGQMQFSEVDVIPGLGNELYASLLGLDANNQVLVRFSVKPLINWLWIGGILLTLFPLLGLLRRKSAESAT